MTEKPSKKPLPALRLPRFFRPQLWGACLSLAILWAFFLFFAIKLQDEQNRMLLSENSDVIEPFALQVYATPRALEIKEAVLGTILAAVGKNANTSLLIIDLDGQVITSVGTLYEKRIATVAPFELPELHHARTKKGAGFYRMWNDPPWDSTYFSAKIVGSSTTPLFYLAIARHDRSFSKRVLFWGCLVTLFAVFVGAIPGFVSARRFYSNMTHLLHFSQTLGIGNGIGNSRVETIDLIEPSEDLGQLAQSMVALGARIQANEELSNRLERVRKTFSENIAHELKTPLTSIRGYVETLLDGALNDTRVAKKFLTIIFENVGRLDALVKDLLTLASVEAEKQTALRSPQRWSQVLTPVLDRLRPAIESKGLTLINQLQPTDPLVWGGERSMSHILDNLLQNAINYTNPGGSIRIYLRSYPSPSPSPSPSSSHSTGQKEHTPETSLTQCLAIEDTGIGISPQNLTRIFERFYRVDPDRSRQTGGTGLGLAIVKHLVAKLGGKVVAFSEVSKGSRFEVHLTLCDQPLPLEQP